MPQEIRRAPGVLAASVDGRAVLVTADGTEMITLNPVGSIVWEALGDAAAVDDLVVAVTTRFPDVEVERVRSDVVTFVEELRAADLVAISES